MPSLNYSKWDKLELSDDSDIEGHPNVDKKSLIRWKQRDIHEKREARKLHIQHLRAEIETTNILLPRIRSLINSIHTNGPKEFSLLMERLKAEPSPEGPPPAPGPPGAPKAPSYDEMILQLMYKVWDDVRGEVDVKEEDKLGKRLEKELNMHFSKLEERLEECHTDLAKDEKEQKDKITSEDIKDGFESHYVPPPKPAEPEPAPKQKSKQKKTETVVEVLNAPKTLEKHADEPVPKESSGYEEDVEDAEDADDETDDDEELPELTPALIAFSKIPPRAYEEAYAFLQNNRSILGPSSMDQLLVAGFTAEMKGDSKYAKGCVHQALLLQYCDKLGKDGVSLFFKRMTSTNPTAERVFLKDVEDTYNLMAQRAANTKKAEEEDGGREQIQLHMENPDTVISFNIPDGAPPALEDLTLEGEGSEQLDTADVHRWLSRRWEIWEGFPKKLRKALRTKELDEVNKVLGNMSVEEAEKVVGEMSEAGILSFSEEGIRDETPQGLAAAAAAAAAEGSAAGVSGEAPEEVD